MRTVTAIICAGVLAAGCGQRTDEAPPAPPPQPEPLSVTYVCAGGAGAEARYGSAGQLTLVFGQTSFPMRAAEAVSGSRWVGESLEWWVTLEAGDEVGTLRQLGPDGVGREVVARCVRPMAGGVLAPEPGQPADPVACRPEDLDLRPVGTDAGAGQRWTTLALRNRGDAACLLEGYPSLGLEGEGGALRTDLRLDRTPGPYYAQRDIAPVTLDPNGEAYFDLGWTVVAGEIATEAEPCDAVTAVRAGPSDADPTARTELEAAPCNGRIRVTPVRPTSAPEG